MTLSATALVHEAYIKLADASPRPILKRPATSTLAAAEAMRRILVDHAAARLAQKRVAPASRLGSSILENAPNSQI